MDKLLITLDIAKIERYKIMILKIRKTILILNPNLLSIKALKLE